ncbi:hypothetical protein SAPIO_CDS8034 [Scedosporium apiospermum]|uniref:Uncharacterized protein n=1 Tax=Pseudallescheria apiosperma TaxID=563466 RepID=A0A084G0D5_PSEDA|nr:uncharacterized protein SAPIO_CDS8034 [Scedosporium apiospermum]KEZ40797.1 hypothetical protein SAPIO_CDS8034 [Scedosporium apiospermum]
MGIRTSPPGNQMHETMLGGLNFWRRFVLRTEDKRSLGTGNHENSSCPISRNLLHSRFNILASKVHKVLSSTFQTKVALSFPRINGDGSEAAESAVARQLDPEVAEAASRTTNHDPVIVRHIFQFLNSARHSEASAEQWRRDFAGNSIRNPRHIPGIGHGVLLQGSRGPAASVNLLRAIVLETPLAYRTFSTGAVQPLNPYSLTNHGFCDTRPGLDNDSHSLMADDWLTNWDIVTDPDPDILAGVFDHRGLLNSWDRNGHLQN